MRRAVILASSAIAFFFGATSSTAQFLPRINLPKAVIDRIESATTAKQVTDAVKALPSAEQLAVMRALRVDPRIVGGFGVDITQVPWQVALIRGYAPEPMRSQFCGGTLIAPDIVLTAAHCVDNSIVRKDATRLHIVSGTDFYASGGDRVPVNAINIHPQWDSSTYDYDFAVLKLARAVTTGQVVPIQTTEPAINSFARVSGWGARAEGGQGTPDLLAADVPVVDRGICNADESYGGSITTSMICAGVRDGGIDSCQGDSGGPLVGGLPSAARLIGVVSWGEGCGRRLKFGVYADVAHVATWLKSFSAQIASAPGDPTLQLAAAR